LDLFRACQADGYLIRNYDHLGRFDGCRCVADFSFNLANPLAAHYFRTRYGLARLTAAYDLNPAQLETLLRRAPPAWFEITLHQRMPLFHMEHCLFCAFLSTGANYADCGHPCERHELRLRDRVGALHVVRADAACRNTVFHAVAQTGAEHLARWVTLGARHFRLEFLNETPREVTRAVTMYQRLLRGELTGAQLWRQLKLDHRLGVAGNDFGRWADRP
jgi:putative protease